MVGGDIGDDFPFIPPPSRESLPTRLKRPRYLEPKRAPTQRPQQAGERVVIPQPREAARVSTAPTEEHCPPSQPRGRIRFVEGGESLPLPHQGVPTGAKGKGKAVASSEPPPSVEKPASPPSLEVLMLDLSLFEEPLQKDPDKEVISSLGFVYKKEVTKKVHDLLRDSTPFQMAASVSILLYLCWSFLFSILNTVTVVDEHF